MANYRVDPAVLEPFLPFGTTLDFYSNTCYVSLIGFMFQDTTLGGIPIPFHQSFEEVNLRFYVCSEQNGESKRGVVFIKELVPSPAVVLVANVFYNEHYESCLMRHEWKILSDSQQIGYHWKKHKWHSLKIVSDILPKKLTEGSPEAFFTEHYLGCTRIRDKLTLEYTVTHDPWLVYDTREFSIDVDFSLVYGEAFAFLNETEPSSVFLAEGSGISLMKSRKIKG